MTVVDAVTSRRSVRAFTGEAVEQGLATCPQESWSRYPATITNFLGTPSEKMLFCGMAVGFEGVEHPVNQLRSVRAPQE